MTPEEARAELDVLQAQVSAIATREAHEPVTLASDVMPLAETVVGRSRRGLLLLLAAIARGAADRVLEPRQPRR